MFLFFFIENYSVSDGEERWILCSFDVYARADGATRAIFRVTFKASMQTNRFNQVLFSSISRRNFSIKDFFHLIYTFICSSFQDIRLLGIILL
jgi:hypothetical protein